MKKIELILNPIYWPVWFGLGLLWLITCLPYRWQLTIGKCLGQVLYLFPSKFKKTTEINIKLCFPNLTLEEQHQLIKKNFINVGMGLVEAGMAWFMSDARLKKLIHFPYPENIQNALNKNKGVIMLTPHFTCLEMVGRLFSLRHTFTALFRPHKKSLVAYILGRFRAHPNVSYIPRHKMRSVIETLEAGKLLWYAYDIDGGLKRSVFAPFFGIETASLNTVSRLTEKTGACVMPGYFSRRDDYKGYDLVLLPELSDFPSGDLVKDATRLNAKLEEAIRLHPEQYIWQYKRFKTRPPGSKRFYIR